MRCGICNSEEHFRAQCPRNAGGGGSFGGYTLQVEEVQELGPLSDLLYGERAYPIFGVEVPTDESADIEIRYGDETGITLADRSQASNEGWRVPGEPASGQWPARPWPMQEEANAPELSDIDRHSSSHSQMPIPP